jgi:hypothetical protein
MNAIKGYLLPGKDKNGKKAAESAAAEKPRATASPTSDGFSSDIPARSPMASRPSSIYPQGDFRNSPRESILDIKADVMVSWLQQQQLERLWAHNMPGEGVVLKKGRDSYTCCPVELRSDHGGFYDQVVAMNVRVSH